MLEIKRESLIIFIVAALVVGYVIGRSATKRELAALPAEARAIAYDQLQRGGVAPAQTQPGLAPPSPTTAVAPAAPRTAVAPAAPTTAVAPAAPVAPAPVAAAPAPAPAPRPAAAAARPAPRPAPAPMASSAPAPVKRLEKIWQVSIHDDDASVGPKDAPVTVVLFSAFGCQPCMQFAPELDKLLADPTYKDKIRVHFKHKIFDAPSPDAFIAAKAAAAAQLQGKFWDMRTALHGARFNVGRESVIQVAQQVGLNMAKFKKDLDSDAVRAKVLRDSLVAYEAGAHSFPNILANGVRIKKPKNFDSLKKLVDNQIQRAAELAKQGLKGKALYAAAIKGGKKFPQLGNPVPGFTNAGAPTQGAARGSIQMVAFEDFECPFCAKSAPNLKEFVDRYPKDVTFVFKHFPLDIHANAPLAHEASLEAVAQGKFWQFHDKLFANQKALSAEDLERYAKEVGMNVGKYKAALKAGTHKPVLQRDMRDGRRAQVSGTPTIFLNGRKYQGPRGYNPLGLEAVAREYLGMKPKK